jgi:outer membrane lipoprotein-sorting protein
VHTPAILERHPALRWLVPVGVICVAGLAATGIFKANASSESLPQTTPAALIAAVQHSHVDGFSGTVVSNLSLGLPDLPSVPGEAGQDTSFGALLSGSHTMQVWYGGFDRQRVALLGATDETDVFRNGRHVWQWSSSDGVAVHTLLPARAERRLEPLIDGSATPAELARRALDAMSPSTEVSVDQGHTVADRSAYELVLTPRSHETKIGSVHISVDGATKVPLGVQVYPRGSASAAIDIAFTSIHFGPQADRNFVFSPPPNAQVREPAIRHSTSGHASAPVVTHSGSGWTAVVGVKAGKATIAKYVQGPLLKRLSSVSGSWGKGRLLDAPLFSMLITDDGRVYCGAVQPADVVAAVRAN